MPKIKKANWITTNELQEAAKALKMVKTFITMVEADTYHWKWILVALHNSLQNFMVCALRGGDGLNILKDSAVRKWLAAGKKGSHPSELDTFLNLYKKIKTDRMLLNKQSKVYNPRGKQDRSVRKINQLRNTFLHFKPKSWHLEINGLPAIAIDITEIIKFLVFTSGNIKPQKEAREEIKQDIEEIFTQLNRLAAVYGN